MTFDGLVGSTLSGKYQLDQFIKEEQLGKVYAATRLSDLTRVDVKVLHPHLADNREVLQRFGREMLATATLRHPNTIEMLDFEDDRIYHYLVLEHIEGRTLAKVLEEEGALSVERTAHIGAQIAAALDAAQSEQITHRNLSSESILLAPGEGGWDLVKVRDFGLSKLQDPDADDQVTQVGMRVGDPTYMAPEYIGEGRVDTRGDLYALGVLLFEMLTGEPVFVARNKGLLLDMHIDQPPRTPSKLSRKVPKWMDALVLSLLAKEPEGRPARGAVVVEALQAGVGHSLGAPAPARGRSVAAPSSGGRARWVALGVAALLGGLGLVGIALVAAFFLLR